jgi:hypothetical protein
MNEYGSGKAAPPPMPREAIELERAASYLAEKVRFHLPDRYWVNIEADISVVIMRLVFHYGIERKKLIGTVEIDLRPGQPIDDRAWLDSYVSNVVDLIRDGESDLIIPQSLDYLRYCDDAGKTLYQEGSFFEEPGN